jgi:hypothetical protein
VFKFHCGVFAAVFFVSSAWASEHVCIVPEIDNKVSTTKNTNGNLLSKWKILDNIISDYYIIKAVKCSKYKRIIDLNYLNKIINKSFPGYSYEKNTDWFSAPASNYGHARVFYSEKSPRIFVKESFYLDFKGRVFVNNIFFMVFKVNETRPNFFELNYGEQKVLKREKSCMRCHQTVSAQNFLFGKYP